MRPYTRSLDPADYLYLQRYVVPLTNFQSGMAARGVPHREWHPHRFWEYASVLQQLDDLGVKSDAEMIDVGAGASFFDPFLALRYPLLCCTDSMKYGDVRPMVQAQRQFYGVSLPLYDLPCEDMAAWPEIGWGGATDKFDVTMCISTIEHVDDHDAAMRELVRITKPGGFLFITSDYFRDLAHFEQSISRHLQVTPYREEFVLALPARFGLEFIGDTDLGYRGDFVHNYSFVNVCLRKPVSTPAQAGDNGKG
ncbi:MAG: class I SAM-dependent methyltransferase [Sulfuricaulis sp.]|nr:class I SAM-dependent methyltransferase [Sulfuricaulis sp.]